MKDLDDEYCLSDLQPIAFLEGGKGLDGAEEYMLKSCQYWNVDHWLIDELYEKQERLAALKFLKPKTLVVGTTGVYRDKISQLVDIFFSLEIKSLEYIVLTMNSEDVFYQYFEKLPNVKMLKANQFFRLMINDVDKDRITFYELEK